MKLNIIIFLGTIIVISTCSAKTIISLIDPRIVSIQINENHESLIDLKNQSAIQYGPSPEVPNNNDYTKIRNTVYKKLLEAQNKLPAELRLCLYEGYRSLSLQEKLFNDRYQKLKHQHIDWTHEQLFSETTKLVSPITNLDGGSNTPPHSTGAAIDVYLIDTNGEIVDMGIKVENWMDDIDGSISKTDSEKISSLAQKNRTLMSDALSHVGFINYPGEYWHWSYGDKYWAFSEKKTYAIYGTVKR